jgi:hypothetical protein
MAAMHGIHGMPGLTCISTAEASSIGFKTGALAKADQLQVQELGLRLNRRIAIAHQHEEGRAIRWGEKGNDLKSKQSRQQYKAGQRRQLH